MLTLWRWCILIPEGTWTVNWTSTEGKCLSEILETNPSQHNTIVRTIMSDYYSLIHCYGSEEETKEITKRWNERVCYYMGACWRLFKVLEADITSNSRQGRAYRHPEDCTIKMIHSYFLSCSIFLALRHFENLSAFDISKSFASLFHMVNITGKTLMLIKWACT